MTRPVKFSNKQKEIMQQSIDAAKASAYAVGFRDAENKYKALMRQNAEEREALAAMTKLANSLGQSIEALSRGLQSFKGQL